MPSDTLASSKHDFATGPHPLFGCLGLSFFRHAVVRRSMPGQDDDPLLSQGAVKPTVFLTSTFGFRSAAKERWTSGGAEMLGYPKAEVRRKRG